MLKVSVGFSRKVSRDYNSTGFSLNLEGEVCVPLDDPELVIGKIQELYDLAEETLNQQVERYESESAIASRDAAPAVSQSARSTTATSPVSARNGRSSANGNSRNAHSSYGTPQFQPESGTNAAQPEFAPASNKQISFITNLAKRQGLATPQLRQRVTEIVGREVDLYDLSKQEAGIVLDELTATAPATTARRR